MFITFVAFALWHAAEPTLLVFGIAHALLYSLERITSWDRRLAALPGGQIIAALLVFAIFAVTLVAFRAGSLEQMQMILGTMFSTQTVDHPFIASVDFSPGYWILPAVFVLGHVMILFGIDCVPRARWMQRLAPIGVALLLVLIVGMRAAWPVPFIYGGR